MEFVKMHGAGNDFVIVNQQRNTLSEEALPLLARGACQRQFGIGSDGLLVVLPSRVANLRMRMFNPDGTEAEMCGNGIRCFAKYVFDRRIHTDVVLTVETLGGIKTIKINAIGGSVKTVRVDMGEPGLMRSEIPMRGNESTRVVGEQLKVSGKKFEITGVSMGNPHCIMFVDNVDTFPVEKIGPEIENHLSFPQRTNVEFVQVLNQQEIKMRVWERGAGETLACGTGACASAVASMLNERTIKKVTVHLRGGDLLVDWLGDGKVYMTGPAEEVFTGKVNPHTFKQWTVE